MLYLAAVLIVIGISLFVAAPWFESAGRIRRARTISELARLEHERALAVQGLRELEFDHQMRKLSDEDCAALKQVLEARALSVMARIDKLSARVPVPITRGAEGAGGFCPSCGSKRPAEGNFCAQCGAPLPPVLTQARQTR